MNIGTIESAIRIIGGIVLLIITFLYTRSFSEFAVILWLVGMYLLGTGLFLSCPVYSMLGVKAKK